MTCTQIKLYGERNTGTNYLDEVLALNFDAERLRGGAPAEINKQKRPQAEKEALRDEHDAATYAVTLGWKHREVDLDSLARLAPPGGNIFVVTLTKNPYSWLLSLKKRPYHYRGDKKCSFHDFLRTPWETVGREGHAAPYANPVQMWNAKNGAYLALEGRVAVYNMTYEALLADPAAELAALSTRCGIPLRGGAYTPLDTAAKERDQQEGKDSGYYRDYYLAERWRDKLTADDIAFINTQLDPSVVAAFGYALITPR